MIDTQLLNNVLWTLASVVGLVVVISAWIVTAGALHERNQRKARIGAIEQHLADVAGEHSPAASR